MIKNIINDENFTVEKVIAWAVIKYPNKYQEDIKSQIRVESVTISKDSHLDVLEDAIITKDEEIIKTISVRENYYKIFTCINGKDLECIGFDIKGLSDRIDWKTKRELMIKEWKEVEENKKNMMNDRN